VKKSHTYGDRHRTSVPTARSLGWSIFFPSSERSDVRVLFVANRGSVDSNEMPRRSGATALPTDRLTFHARLFGPALM
jgi:hypothetical protein